MSVTLNTGLKMPLIGIGTWRMTGYQAVRDALDSAFSAGYRVIDTASVYRNEEDIGTALVELLPKHSLSRKDIFITSKLGPAQHGRDKCHQIFAESLRKLRTDYLDLFLIHWPGVSGSKPEDEQQVSLRKESWLAMEDLYKKGKVKAIGVSNYTVRHLKDILKYASVVPAVNQVECHPYLVQKELREFCTQSNVFFQAYSSLGTMDEQKQLVNDATVTQIAAKYQKSPAQILLKWAVQQGIGVLPKSTTSHHIAQNIDIFNFELTEEDINTISSLNKDHHFAWNPETIV